MNENSEVIINSTVAVVDRIPEPSDATVNTALKRLNDDRPAKSCSLEGVSFLLMGIGHKYRICRQHNQALTNDDCGDAKDTFTVYTSGYCETQEMRKSGNLQLYTSAIQVPLTNTSLRNGLPSTVFLYKWRLLGKENMLLTDRRKLDKTKLYWPSVPEISGDARHLILSTSLYPLTHPRVVKSSMGNVIRSITKVLPSEHEPERESIDGIDENSFTASKELEEAMATCFASGAVDPNDANVWALIIPRNIYEKDFYLWENVDMVYSDLFQNQNRISQYAQESSAIERFILRLIEKGARLHKVTSGGGGWGNRAGLLSLDPEYSFGTQNEFSLKEFSSGWGTFPSVASPGSIIQFFIRHKDNGITVKDGNNEKGLRPDHEAPIGNFEVLYDTTGDDVESQSTNDANDSSPVLRAYDNYFGAASGKGLGIGLSQWDKRILENSDKRIRKSKLDVPGSKISIQVNAKYGFIPEERKSRVLCKKLSGSDRTFEEKLDALKRLKLDLSSDMLPSGVVATRYNESTQNSLAKDKPSKSSDIDANSQQLRASEMRPKTPEGDHMQPSTTNSDPRHILSTREHKRTPNSEKHQLSQLRKGRVRTVITQKESETYERTIFCVGRKKRSYAIWRYVTDRRKMIPEARKRKKNRGKSIRLVRNGWKVRRLHFQFHKDLESVYRPKTDDKPDLVAGVASFLKG